MNTVKVIFKNPKYNYRTSVNSKSTEKELRKYFVGGMFDVGKYPKENLQEVIDINLEKPTDTKDHLLLKGYTAYDMARHKAQSEQIADGVRTAYSQVEVIRTTTEANKEEYPYIIYVNEESIKRNKDRDFGKESLEVFNRGNESEQKKRKPKGKRKPNGYFQALGQARRSNAKSFKYKGKTYVRKEVKAKTSDTVLVYYKKVDFSGAFGGFFN